MTWVKDYMRKRSNRRHRGNAHYSTAPFATELMAYFRGVEYNHNRVLEELADYVTLTPYSNQFICLGTLAMIEWSCKPALIHAIGRLRDEYLRFDASDPKQTMMNVDVINRLMLVFQGIGYPGGVDCYCAGGGSLLKEKFGHQNAYPAITSNMRNICAISIAYPKWLRSKFVDVGCGVGDKVCAFAMLANDANMYNATGIDHDWYPIAIAQRAAGACNMSRYTNFECEDATEVNYFDRFGSVYTYVPIRASSKKVSDKFYGNIAKQLEPGTMWYEVVGLPVGVIGKYNLVPAQEVMSIPEEVISEYGFGACRNVYVKE
jgi:2-polyprenyl-3-methyl-5-hydroxy-6-metoxy-1,4-benzoquinol methylase